jgi:hypothetical protein
MSPFCSSNLSGGLFNSYVDPTIDWCTQNKLSLLVHMYKYAATPSSQLQSADTYKKPDHFILGLSENLLNQL